MTLQDAKALRTTIKASGYHCIVPLGHGPRRYFARIFGHGTQVIDFRSVAAFKRFDVKAQLERKRIVQFYREHVARPLPARSGMEIMIDRACGVTKR